MLICYAVQLTLQPFKPSLNLIKPSGFSSIVLLSRSIVTQT